MRLTLCLTALILCQTLVGCSSFSANFLYRSEDNQSWLRKKHLRGVPVTLKIPTHVRIDVIEKRYMFLNGDGKIIQDSPGFPIRSVKYTPIETEEIFLVDIKRPGAGTIDTTIEFDAENQYFKEIKTDITDTTIESISSLIGSIAPGGLIGAPTSEVVPAAYTNRVKEVESVVASKVFEFEAPDFELLVGDFLGQHLNCCHDCGQPRSSIAPTSNHNNTEPESLEPTDTGYYAPPLPSTSSNATQVRKGAFSNVRR